MWVASGWTPGGALGPGTYFRAVFAIRLHGRLYEVNPSFRRDTQRHGVTDARMLTHLPPGTLISYRVAISGGLGGGGRVRGCWG